jgi:hypothetical protein
MEAVLDLTLRMIYMKVGVIVNTDQLIEKSLNKEKAAAAAGGKESNSGPKECGNSSEDSTSQKTATTSQPNLNLSGETIILTCPRILLPARKMQPTLGLRSVEILKTVTIWSIL